MKKEHPHDIQMCTINNVMFPIKEPTGKQTTPLYYRGTLANTLSRIAIVGTRNASEYGIRIAKKIAYDLASHGWCVVSGLALGIDGAAHQGALHAGGITWAVIAHGLETIHPRQHEHLAETIIQTGGCLISQYPPHTPPYASNFLERNYIINALSEAVLVIEAPHGSGSLVTARHAAKDKKPIFVIPGPVTSPQYAGSLELLRSGARLVRNADDILHDLHAQRLIPNHEPIMYPEPCKKILQCFTTQQSIQSLDELIEHTRLSYHIVQEALHTLLVAHMLEEVGLQTYRRI